MFGHRPKPLSNWFGDKSNNSLYNEKPKASEQKQETPTWRCTNLILDEQVGSSGLFRCAVGIVT